MPALAHPQAFNLPLPLPEEGVWVSQASLLIDDVTIPPEADAMAVFGLRETAIRNLWATGQVRFERFRPAKKSGPDAKRLRAAVADLEKRRDDLVKEVSELIAMQREAERFVAALRRAQAEIETVDPEELNEETGG